MELNLGIVAKIDMTEVRAPFIRAATVVGGVALVIIISGVILFRHISYPVIRRLESKLIEYKELNEFKTNLLSTVSHELRTPMAIIKGYSTLMLDYASKLDDSEKNQYLTSINRATDRLMELVGHILDMSRLESGLLGLEKTRTSLSRIIEEAVAEAKLRAPTHKITSKSHGKLPEISADARRIRQVLDNILDNAIKYSAENTKIKISAQGGPGELLVSITDEGIGISEE